MVPNVVPVDTRSPLKTTFKASKLVLKMHTFQKIKKGQKNSSA